MARPIAVSASCWRWARVRVSRSTVCGVGFLVDADGFVGGVALAGHGPTGEHRFESGAGLGVEPAADLTHPVGLLLAQMDPPLAGAVLVVGGHLPVGVEQREQQRRGRPEFFRRVASGHRHEIGFGSVESLRIDEAGNLGEELAHLLDVVGADVAAGVGGGGVGPRRLQRLPAQRVAGSEVGGVGEAAAGVAGGDPQRGGQHVVVAAAPQCRGVGLGQPGDQPVLVGGQLAQDPLPAGHDPHQLGVGERVVGRVGHGLAGRVQLVVHRVDRAHISNISSRVRQESGRAQHRDLTIRRRRSPPRSTDQDEW
jgi:hypothetical protein